MDEFEFWIILAGVMSSFFGLTLRACLKSKCDEVNCFCLKIHRNTEQETNTELTLPNNSPRGFSRV